MRLSKLAAARPVVVVGAGPVGLTAALALRAVGLSVVVLEAEAKDQAQRGSRAIFVHRESLELLERLRPGLGWEVARQGLVWRTKRTYWRAREVYARTYPPGDPRRLPPATNLAQTETERLLLDSCRESGVEFVWNERVSTLECDPSGVRVGSEAGTTWAADYVVAADGARSAVRRALGVPMDGSRSENSFVIVDLEEDPAAPLPVERVFHYEHPAVGGRNVLLVPFAGSWRADLMCRVDDDPGRFSDEAGVERWIRQVLPERYGDRITWVSTYQFLQVVAASFADRHRRVLLVGEAAHLFAPFGARGMNSGLPDAAAAAAAVRTGVEASDPAIGRAAVDEFAATRRAAALYNRDAAGAALAHMQARGPGIRARRRVAARLARVGVERAGAWLDSAPYGPRAARRAGRGTY